MNIKPIRNDEDLHAAFKQLELVAHPLRKSIVRCIVDYSSSQAGAWELERLPTK
jgi:hypothetical protein